MFLRGPPSHPMESLIPHRFTLSIYGCWNILLMPGESPWGVELLWEHRPNGGPNDLNQDEQQLWLPTGSPNKPLQRPPPAPNAANKQ